MNNSFFRSSSVTHVWLDDSLVILETNTGKYYSLNHVASQFFLSLNDEPNDYKEQYETWISADNEAETSLLKTILEPLPAAARVTILEMLKNGLIRLNPYKKKSQRLLFDYSEVAPSISCWGTVASATYSRAGG